jgi:hypothetical protein
MMSYLVVLADAFKHIRVNARNNTHGLPNSLDPSDPLYCTNASASVQAAYPCNLADDQAWSRVVLVQRDDVVNRIRQAGQGGQQATVPVDGSTCTPTT